MRELEEALQSPLVRDREMLLEVHQPGDSESLTVLGAPVRMSANPPRDALPPAPRLGEHTVEVLTQAGLHESDIDLLLRANAASLG